MSFEWETFKIGDIANVQTGPFGSQLHKEDYVESGTPIITVEHLGENRIIHENTPFVSDEDATRLNKYTLREGDIVFSRVGSVDRRAYVSRKEDGWLFSGRCLRVRVIDTKRIYPRYLSYYFGLETFKEHVRNIAVGATMPSLNTKIMANLEIKAPKLADQIAITSILSSLDDKIELNNAINKNLEEIAQALFKRWFVDFEFPNEDGDPYKASGGEFEESELGPIPKGWQVGSIQDLIIAISGGDWGKDSPQGNHVHEVSCIRGADIPELRKGALGKVPRRFILPKNVSRKVLSHGDIVIEISGGSPTQSTGRAVLIVDEILQKFEAPLICTNFCRVIKPLSDYGDYLYSYLSYLYQEGILFQYENGTTGIKNLDITSLLNVHRVAIPTIEVARQYASMFHELYRTIQLLGAQAHKLAEIRDALLPKLMSGEIRVPIEEAELEEMR
ncbi:restriction endonuclease subunit S [Alicyclobacillus herbarius]|uniref:restriction endonuclease subunit S n=1 Tax=Alicyclobacillus herbarius TaxID=122960 RepID=UPI0004013126|nr:restriction endonuclease subunit S [Alicyclobacillus herbarius]